MLRFLFKSVVDNKRHTTVVNISYRRIASNPENFYQTEPSFAVTYLIATCGLSPESALSASKLVRFENPEKPDSVLAVLRNYGFSRPHISKIVEKMPTLLACKPEKTILPKLEFLSSKGLLNPDIVNVVSACPAYLHRSLKNHIVPSFGFLRDLLKSDEKTVLAIKRCPFLLHTDLEASILPRIKILRDNGVGELNVVRLIFYWPGMFFSKMDKFKMNVEEARKLGFNPLKFQFCFAMGAIKGMKAPIWERKVNLFKSWGLSDEEIIEAFKKCPTIMMSSEEKMRRSMDLFVGKLGWERSFLLKHLYLVTMSLEKRLIPRASVLQFLVSKGLLKKEYRSSSFFKYPETEFLQRFIHRYAEYPELLKLYGKKSCSKNKKAE